MARNRYSRFYLNEKFEDVRFELIPIYDRMVGEPFVVRLNMSNKSHKVYTVELTLIVRTNTYNGVDKAIIKQENMFKTLGPRKTQDVSATVSYEEYENSLASQAIFTISVMANVIEADYQVCCSFSLSL